MSDRDEPQGRTPGRPQGNPLPPSWAQRIDALVRGELTPPQPRLASTVVLLRNHVGGAEARGAESRAERAEAGLQAYLLRRRSSMAFAGGMYAYPGGGVDPRDGTTAIGWAGPSAEEWGVRLGCPPETARAVVCAAVRETFEEAGVLLAGADEHSVVADVSGEQWRADRVALEGHELSFAEFLTRRGLVLRSDLLGGWARWITPEFEERRYDTWFFVAAVPEGQRTAEVPGEADRVEWLSPGEAVRRAESGEFLMLPPTVTTLRELEPYGAAAQALEAARKREIAPIMARAQIVDGRVSVSWSGHPELTMGAGT
ncbi:8-oxo-dGTP pyrophosphatase MutT (NUDIX family) [Streptacidiphilus sp. MAP12-16]|uniref:NUDIX hydrolase n=1 Tax=Streptacidiphilus sp. MAP12-16 TaxID=3156300 RepID=UPI003518FC88